MSLATKHSSLIFAIGVGAVSVIAGCGLVPSPSQNPYISTPNVSVNQRDVAITGQTGLPDGAVLVFTAVRDCNQAGCITKGTSSPVSRGAYAASLDLAGWPAGTDTMWVEFHPNREQPSAVANAYGSDGSKMSGSRLRREEGSDGWYWFAEVDFGLS